MSLQETCRMTRRSLKISGFLSALRWMSGITVFACAVGLAMTGFYGMPGQVDVYGYARMSHVTMGGVFAVALAVWALLTAQIHGFSEGNGAGLKSRCEPDHLARAHTAQKLCYWMILVSAVPLILSVTLNMFAWFGMMQQVWVVIVHRWSAAMVISSATLYLLLILGPCFNRREKSK